MFGLSELLINNTGYLRLKVLATTALLMLSSHVEAGKPPSPTPTGTLILQRLQHLDGIPKAFSQIGDPEKVYQLGGLAWSDRASEFMTHEVAIKFCQNTGGRLPTREEMEALRRAMGYPSHFNRYAMPNMYEYFFWSSTLAPPRPGKLARAYGLGCTFGDIYDADRAGRRSVRCVTTIPPRAR